MNYASADWVPKDIIELGSQNVNGSYRTLFPEGVNYTGLDMAEGPGVDIVLEDPYKLPQESESVDLVISGQMLEHCPYFWEVFKEIERVLKKGGRAFIIAPSSGKIHRYPVDCYRFYPDSFEALAQWSGLALVDSWIDQRGPWRDLVGVFTKKGEVKKVSKPQIKPEPSKAIDFHSNPEVEKISGERSYVEVLRYIHELVKPKNYLEIGIKKGKSLRLSSCDSLAIDPYPRMESIPSNVRLFETTSDDFFFFFAEQEIKKPLDLAFIDGMHLFEFVLRDFMNVERYMSTNGIIIIDDVLPNHPVQAERDRKSQVWCGDVWRLSRLLQEKRPDLKLTWLNTSPSGLLLITRPNPKNNTLWEQYNPLVRKYLDTNPVPPQDILERKNAKTPSNKEIQKAIKPILDKKKNLDLSIFVCAYDMARELPRTIFTLSRKYQQEISDLNYEVIVIDHGSPEPVDVLALRKIIKNLKVIRFENAPKSPVKAINSVIGKCQTPMIGMLIDGARMLSPGLISTAVSALKLDNDKVVGTLSFHLGPDVQMKSVLDGYDQEAEDHLLNSIGWEDDGYVLFKNSVLAGSSSNGWFNPIAESNAVFMSLRKWNEIGGFNESYQQSGGGKANIEFWSRAVKASEGRPWILLGEGTFHQVHGGAATNSSEEIRNEIRKEHINILGGKRNILDYKPRFIGGALPKD
jgi:SAM-dependent methyltransferase